MNLTLALQLFLVKEWVDNELFFNTNPFVRTLDNDSDGVPDTWELDYGLNPNTNDTDDDNLSDLEEAVTYFTSPNSNDTDEDDLTE